MKVVLYPPHRSRPFSKSEYEPDQPIALFDPETMASYSLKKNNQNDDNENTTLDQDDYLWSFLVGLHQLQFNGMMAHVSIDVDPEKKMFKIPNYLTFSITTEPKETAPDGLPLIKGNKDIAGLWIEYTTTREYKYELMYVYERTVEKSIRTPEQQTAQFGEYFRSISEKIKSDIKKKEKTLEEFLSQAGIYSIAFSAPVV